MGDFLAKHRNEPLAVGLLARSDSKGSGLGHQTAAWLSILSPGIVVDAELLDQVDRARTFFSYPGTAERRPEHVGFGLSYALPIVVRVLSCIPGDILLVENPEAHLHPKGQRQLGRMLALAAKGGIQVVVETHSDHLMNGIRLAVAGEDRLSADSVRILHFQYDATNGDAPRTVARIRVDEAGRLSAWPEDFFDEWEKGLDQLVDAQGRK